MSKVDSDDLPTVRGLAPGQKVFGRYVLESVLGQGGMGVVWRARDNELGSLVALKFLPEIVARDEVAVDELKEETRNALRLTHPNIVRIHHFERDGNMAAVSMEFVDGVTLSKLRLAQPGKVFSVETLAPLLVQLCGALVYAHAEAKVIHRDLKPANLLVTPDGRLKIADFGIARSLADTHTRLTGRTVGTSGTLLYMSPQQLLGMKASATDDIYALGATLYELLTGRPPFFTGDIATQVRSVIPPSIAERRRELETVGEPIPAAWEETVAACLTKDAMQRPQTAGVVAARLGFTESRETVKTSSLVIERSPATGARHTTSRKSLRVLLVAGFPVLALGALIYSFWPRTRPLSEKSTYQFARVTEVKANAERGDAMAQADLGWFYRDGWGVPKDSAKAVRWLREAADRGNALGQYRLGEMYANGDGVPKDAAIAVEWFRKAADQGQPHAQYRLGWMYANGIGVPEDSSEAAKWYRKAADQSIPQAQFSLGWMYANGIGVPKDSTEAVKLYRKGLENPFAHDAGVQYNLGWMCANGEGTPKDDAEAVIWYRKAAEQGNADAQISLGVMYGKGEGVTKDSAEAGKWYRKAADQGDARAQSNLGWMYANGEGVPKDSAEAVKWSRKAADQGNAIAQCNLGNMYFSGNGVPKDSAEAGKWYRKAADQGDARAQFSLGWMYFEGDGVPKDSAEAVTWYRRAAGQGDAVYQSLLGFMYANGHGVPKDSTEAANWYRKAADQGKVDAQIILGLMYLKGDGVPKDSTEAANWYRKAGDQGNAVAQSKLGWMYAIGDGVPQNETEALAWYYLAAAQGHQLAVKYRDELELRLGREATLAAQQRSKEILKEIETAKAR